MGPTPPHLSAAQRRGRTIGAAAFALLIGIPTVHWSRQIILQAWKGPPAPSSARTCRNGLASLLSAVDRARMVAAAESGGERASLARFRHELEPEWLERTSLEATCRADPQGRHLLHELDLLRYAEERTVRQDAIDVARRRRRVHRLANHLGLTVPVALEKPAGRD
ncbi:MAG: hypothetical protein JW751_00245 [Polyangiaceae bacterium]|nr:hypothetical protein [Polyangiaceae bacterium]